MKLMYLSSIMSRSLQSIFSSLMVSLRLSIHDIAGEVVYPLIAPLDELERAYADWAVCSVSCRWRWRSNPYPVVIAF